MARPREAWRTLLRIAGVPTKAVPEEGVHATVAIRGHVLRDVTLDIERGTVVCLTGAPDSATVLLQILDGVIPPTAGVAEIYGSITSLLVAGDALDARRSADENIRSSKRFLEASPEAAEAYAAEVVEFAELQGFEHVPLRTYSTGMTLRLGVALALCGQPSIVLIDDVLAVGDIAFQQKCIDRVRALKEKGCTLVLAFSDEALIRQVATRVITFGDGRIVADTTPGDWMAMRYTSRAADIEWQMLQNLPEDDVVALRSLSLVAGREGDETHVDLSLIFEFKIPGLRCRPSIFLTRGKTVVFRSLYPRVLAVDEPRRMAFTVRVPTYNLSDGDYAIGVSMMTLQGGVVYSLKALDAVTLTIRRSGESLPDAAPAPMLAMAMPWDIEPLAGGGA